MLVTAHFTGLLRSIDYLIYFTFFFNRIWLMLMFFGVFWPKFLMWHYNSDFITTQITCLDWVNFSDVTRSHVNWSKTVRKLNSNNLYWQIVNLLIKLPLCSGSLKKMRKCIAEQLIRWIRIEKSKAHRGPQVLYFELLSIVSTYTLEFT